MPYADRKEDCSTMDGKCRACIFTSFYLIENSMIRDAGIFR
jgi:hypothetical protein